MRIECASVQGVWALEDVALDDVAVHDEMQVNGMKNQTGSVFQGHGAGSRDAEQGVGETNRV